MADIPKISLPDEVKVFNPEGELVAIPASQAQQAQTMGFMPASDQDAQAYLDEQKYGSTGQQAITFAEGAGRGATFGLSSAVERGLGVDPEDIRKRQETNPASSIVGEGAGIVGSSLIPVAGAANLAAHAGEAGAQLAAHALPALAGENIIAKVGSAAIKGAIENAVFATGDEVSKAILQDPNQSFQTAITDIGLGSLIGAGAGGAFGAVNPLWEATAGPKARNFLNMITDRANGSTLPESDAMKLLEKDLESNGISFPPELRAAVSDNPALQQTFNELRESGTMSGEKIRETLSKFSDELNDHLARTIDGGEQISAKEAGDQAKNALAADIEKRSAGVRQAYDSVAPSQEIKVDPIDQTEVYGKLKKAGSEFGAEGSPLRAEFDRWADRFGLQNTVGQVDKLMTELGSEWSVANRAGDFEHRRAIQEIRDIIRDGTNGILDKALPGAKEAAKAARDTYAATIEHIQEIAKAGGMGKVKSIGQFQEALEKVSSEKLATRLFDKNNVRALNYLKDSYPTVFENLSKQMRGEILAKGTTAKGVFNPNNIFREVEKLPEEVKHMVFPQETLDKIGAIRQIRAAIPERINPSGTARTLDTLWRHMPSGGGGVVSAVMGHNPIGGMILGQAAKFLGRDVPDAAKLSLLKFLGSTGPVDASAWKTAADLIERTYKGQKLIERATKSVFQAGKAVLPDALYPDEKKTERLDKKLKELGQNPEPMFDIGGKTAQYMPEHAQAMGETAANAVTWLNNQRPKEAQLGILDAKPPVPKEVSDHFKRTLQIAEQPLVSLQHLKDGTLQPADVQTVQTLYPQLYSKLSQGLVSELIDHKSEEEPIPYKTVLGLSMFLAQPLDGTMTPQGIQAIQASLSSPQAGQPGTHGSMKAMSDQASRDMTPGQQRESSHQS